MGSDGIPIITDEYDNVQVDNEDQNYIWNSEEDLLDGSAEPRVESAGPEAADILSSQYPADELPDQYSQVGDCGH